MQDRPISATGASGPKTFSPGDAAYAELAWIGAKLESSPPDHELTYDLLPGVPRALDPWVTRIIAPNAGVMTGPGTNSYLIGTRERAVIDPGPPDEAHIEALLRAGEGRIRWILCTHTHVDHAEGVAKLQQATGARVAAMPMAPGVSESDAGEHNVELVLDHVLTEEESLEIDGMPVRVLFTAGHASNHLCFLLPETGMLFTGDHIMQGSTVVIWPPDGNMRAYLQSLRRLRTFDLNILAPGHGYLIGRPHAEIERLIQHRLAREEKVRNGLAKAGKSATLEALLPLVYDDVAKALHPVAARSLEAHLDKLVEEGEVLCTEGRYTQINEAG